MLLVAIPVGELRSAASLLTRLPVGQAASDRVGSAAFGVVGAALGLVAGVPSALVGGTAPLVGAFLGLAILALLTGALHLDGLADSADALAAPDDARAEAARKDPRTGSAGVVAIVLVLGSAAGSLAAIPASAALAVAAVAGCASRAVPALAAPLVGGRSRSGAPSGFGTWFAARAGWGGATASFATLVVVVAAAILIRPSDPSPAVCAVVGLVLGLVTVLVLHGRFGHLAGDFLGAGVEIGFAAGLAGAAIAEGLIR